MTSTPSSFLEAKYWLDEFKKELDKGFTDNWTPNLYEALEEDLNSYVRRCNAASQPWPNDKANK